MERNGYKYQDAGERLKKLIETMDDGDKLPNRKILSEQLGIARTTLEHSIAELIASGYRPLVGFLTPGVYCNSFESSYVATKFLLDRGCKKIAYFSAPIYQTAYDRYQGFMMALASSGVAQDSHAVFMDSFTYDLAQCYRTILPSFDQYGIPDGIFAFNDRLAQLVYQVLEIRHLRPGRDVKVIGCDNNNLCSELDPRPTSIELPVYEAGRRAAEMLWQYVNDEAVPTSHVFCESCKVIERAST